MSLKNGPEAEARQQELYQFLLSRGDKWTPLEMATDSISAYPTFYMTTYHNSTARRLLTYDIRAINSSDKYQRIIATGNRGLKLATQEEAGKLIKARYKEAKAMLKWVSKIAKKAEKNGAIDFDGKVVESFLEATEHGDR